MINIHIKWYIVFINTILIADINLLIIYKKNKKYVKIRKTLLNTKKETNSKQYKFQSILNFAISMQNYTQKV